MTALPRVGDTFAGYRLDGILGRGGMSTVFRAENVRLGNVVALKILSPDLADDDQFRERFVRESRVASSMNHPNIIPIIDAGQEEGLLYIVMRFVSGSDLKSVLTREGALAPNRCLDIVSQVASALDAAHARDLLHRDVKPGNILLESSGTDYRGEHAYLSDFGLTKHTTSTSGLTRTGHFVGTLDYMAPEQIEVGAVDGRADVYALGCVTFECLTGAPPFARETHAAVLWAHLRDEPPRVTDLRPELPAAIDDVIARALAKSPKDRHQRAGHLVVDLRDALAMERVPPAQETVQGHRPPVAAAPLTGAQPPPTPPAPHREETPARDGGSGRRQISLLAAFALAAGVLALVGGGAIAGVLLSRDSSADGAGVETTMPDEAMTGTDTGSHAGDASGGTLEEIIPQTLFAHCEPTESTLLGAMESVTCVPPSRADGLEVVLFEEAHETMASYESRIAAAGIKPGSGNCSSTRWGGERSWVHAVHGGASADGRVLCYFEGSDSHIVWTVSSSNVLAMAMTEGRDHGDLYRWWAFWHHQLV